MKLKKLLKIYAKAAKIINANNENWGDNWDVIYSKIFSAKISYKINKHLNYSNPDGSYKDDVLAFMEAFKTYIISRL